MKKLSFLLVSIILAFISCNNAEQSSTATVDSTRPDSLPAVPSAIVQCYENQNGADTVQLRISDSAGAITGRLNYRIEGKDANSGSFSGKWFGDTLVADYSFKSEGVQSVRQIAFLKKDSFLFEGFGPVIEENKQMKFKNRDSLSFNEVNRLSLVPCE